MKLRCEDVALVYRAAELDTIIRGGRNAFQVRRLWIIRVHKVDAIFLSKAAKECRILRESQRIPADVRHLQLRGVRFWTLSPIRGSVRRRFRTDSGIHGPFSEREAN